MSTLEESEDRPSSKYIVRLVPQPHHFDVPRLLSVEWLTACLTVSVHSRLQQGPRASAGERAWRWLSGERPAGTLTHLVDSVHPRLARTASFGLAVATGERLLLAPRIQFALGTSLGRGRSTEASV